MPFESGKSDSQSAILQSSNDAVAIVLLDGKIADWNIAAQKIYGFSPKEAIGRNIDIIIPDELLNYEFKMLEKVKQNRRAAHYETSRKTKNGDKILVDLIISPIEDEDGNTVAFSKIATEITPQKRYEEKQAILAAIVSSSDDAIISKTLDGIITSWNDSAQKMFGFTEQEAIGKHISIIIPKERLEEEAMIIDNIRSGKKIDHFETVRISKDGKAINISLTVSPIKNNDGKIIGASKVAKDITEKIELEIQRDLYTERLKNLNKYKDEFMVMASHELKTPITVISANLQLLQLQMKGDDKYKFVDKSLKQLKKLSDLVTDLLDVSKIQAGKLDLNLSTFDINILLEEVKSDIALTAKNHQLIFNEPSSKLLVYADRGRIEQVIVNLLNNAIKYSPNSKEVIIDAKEDNGNILVSIRDHGIAIPSEDLQNIFTRFYRVSGLPALFTGTGVGLYICAEIIQRHNGRIWAESKAGEGSVFYFYIPAHKSMLTPPVAYSNIVEANESISD